MNYFKQISQSAESGVMFILTLMLVAAVGLLVIPLMLIGATALRSTNSTEQRFMERHAVDAGVEQALWNIKYKGDFVDGVPYTRTLNDRSTEITIRPADPEIPVEIPPKPSCQSPQCRATTWSDSTMPGYSAQLTGWTLVRGQAVRKTFSFSPCFSTTMATRISVFLCSAIACPRL